MVKTNIQTFTGEVEILSNLHVGPSGSSYLTANGAASNVLDITGNVGATFFVGDGGFLSNIATTLSDIVNQGNVSANVLQFNSTSDYAGVGLVTSSNVGIQNTAPSHTLSIGDKIRVDDNTVETSGQSVIQVDGRILATRFQGDGGLLSNIATTFESIVNQGNVASNVVKFSSDSAYAGAGVITDSNVGIQNTAPTHNLSVGSNLHVNDTGSNVLTVHGNVVASNLNLGVFSIVPAYGLNDVCNTSNGTTNVVQFQNGTTSLVASSNITASGNITAQTIISTANVEITDRLKFDGNVFVDTLRVADVAANIVTYDRTTGELLDSSGTFMNKFAVVSEQPPSDLFANATTVTNHGGYTLTTSNLATNSNTFNAFDGTANAWVSGDLAGGYIGGANVFHENNLTQLSNLHPTQRGDWLAIEFPYKTTLRHMKLTPLTAAQFPASANIYATNNDLTWTEVNYWKDVNPVTASNVQTITVNATEQFKKYALVATKAAGNSSNVAIKDWQLFTESFSIDGGKVAMAQQAATGGETVMDQHGPHGRGVVPLKKYPEIAFDASKADVFGNSNAYAQAGYEISSTSRYETGVAIDANDIKFAFDGRGDENGSAATPSTLYPHYASQSSSYSTSNPFAYTLFTNNVTDKDGVNYSGEEIKLKLPNKIKLSKLNIVSFSNSGDRQARNGHIFGSNTGANGSWTKIIDFTNLNSVGGSSVGTKSVSVSTVEYFEWYSLVITHLADSGGLLNLRELEYYGYEEDQPLGDTSIDTTFTSIMNTPQTTGAQVYVDGSLGETFTNRVVGPTVSNTHTTYVSAGKYWELSGNVESNVTLEANTFLSGDAPHSLSMWFNSSNLVSNASNSCIFSLGTEERLDHVSAAFSNTYQTVQKIMASDDEQYDVFGWYKTVSMSNDGNHILIGAPGNNSANDEKGAAYYFLKSGTTWSEQQILQPSDPLIDTNFGVSVAISGNGLYAAIGRCDTEYTNQANNAVYIFKLESGSWVQKQKLGLPSGFHATASRFGTDVSLTTAGDCLIVGTGTYSGSNAPGGAVVYNRTNESWVQESALLSGSTTTDDEMGVSAEISGDGNYAIVGAWRDDDDGAQSGTAHIFKRASATTWDSGFKITGTDTTAGDRFGYSVSIDSTGTYAVVGAYYHGSGTPGAAYVFHRSGSTNSWSQQQDLVPTDIASSGAWYGEVVTISPDGLTALIGSRDPTVDVGAGGVHRWTRSGSTWTEQHTFRSSDGAYDDRFGSAIGCSSDASYFVAGALQNDDGGTSSGSAYIFTRDTTHHLITDLKLQSNTWHNLTYAYQGEGGSRVTYLDGRKVAEDQAEDTFGDYPPFAMTGYSQGGYVVSASSEYISGSDDRRSWKVFDGVRTVGSPPELWQTNGSTYTSTTPGVATGAGVQSFIANGVTFNGHWLKLKLPHKLLLNWLKVESGANDERRPWKGAILGSNDDVNWYTLKSFDGDTASTALTWYDGGSSIDVSDIVINSQLAYNYILFVIEETKVGTGHNCLVINQMHLYGHRENDLVRLPDPTNVLKYPHVAMSASNSAGDNRYINRFEEVSTTSEFSTNGGTYSLVKAFDNIDDTSITYWSASKRNSISGNLGRYASGAHGAYNGETPTGKSFIPSNATTVQKGEWIKMKSHHKLKLNKIELLALSTTHKLVPSGVLIWGSDDDSNWTLLKTHIPSGTGGAVTYSSRLGVITVNSTVAYKYHAMVMTHMNNSDSNYTLMSISQMKFFGTEEDISIPLQIGGGNIDKVANFRVYDKFVGEDQALEIWDAQKDEFGRAKSSMTLQKGRLGIGTDEPQGRLAVADEPHGVEEFPPRAMTGYKNYFEGHGEFCVSANSYGAGSSTTRYPWKAFIKGTTESTSNGDNSWLDGSGDFNNATGVYDGSLTHHNGSVSGEYLQLELPYEIQLSSYSLAPWNYPTGGNFQYSDFPRDFIIYGSKDSISWDIVDTRSGQSSTSQADVPKYHVNSQKTYKYFVIVVTKINTAAYANSAVYVAIGEWRLFGTREQGQSVLHDGQLTLTKSLTVPRIGPALDADDTPRRDRLVVEYNTSTNPTFEGAVRDTSGRGLDGVFYGGVSYDATEKALVFDGTNDYVQTNSPSSLSQIHSMSAWIKMDSQTGINSIMHIGTFDTYKESRIFTSGNVLHATIYGSTVAANSNGMTPSRWYHVVYTFVGGTFNTTNVKLFINGTSVTLTQTQTAATSALTGKTITIGSVSTGGEYFKGDISNPKLYDTALTASEVKTLYDMGRCDEGHHMVNFSKTRVGIGLGDGEAPLAMLDSRDTRLAFKYGGTTLDNFEEYVHGGPWVGHHSNGSGGFNVHGPIKYQRIGTFCRAHFDFVQYYANGTFYMKADNVPERFRPVTGGDIMTWYTRVYTNGPISSLTYYDPGNTRWVITASVNGSNFNGGNGTNHSIISTSITYRVA